MTCRKRKLAVDHIILLWPHKDMKRLPIWVISSMPGPPPRQHKHERRNIVHALIHSNKANMEGLLWRPNYIRGPCGPKASWHVLQMRKNLEKKKNTSPRKLVPNRDRTRAWCVTAVNKFAITNPKIQIYAHVITNAMLNFSKSVLLDSGISWIQNILNSIIAVDQIYVSWAARQVN